MLIGHFFRNRHSIFFSWMFSYILLIVASLFICSVAYVVSIRTVENEMTRANTAVLEQLQMSMDNMISSIELFGNQLLIDTEINKMLSFSSPIKPEEYYDVYKAYSNVMAYKLVNGYAEKFYIVFNNFDKVITSDGMKTKEETFKVFHNNDGISFEQWNDFVLKNRTKEYTFIDGKNGSTDGHGSFAYIQTIPGGIDDRAVAVIVILIDNSKMKKSFDITRWLKDGEVLALDNKDRIVFPGKPLYHVAGLQFKDIMNDKGLIYKRLNNRDMAVSYISSKVTAWKYVSVIPTEIFMQKVKYIKNVIFISILICLVLGMTYALYFAKRNYNPLKSILDTFQNRKDSYQNKSGSSTDPFYQKNEYSYIKYLITNTIIEKDRINKELDEKNVALMSNFIIRLLRGRISENIPIEESLNSYGIEFNTDLFAVMVISTENMGIFTIVKDSVEYDKNLDIVQFVIRNVIEELLREKHNAFVVEIDNMLACLVNFNYLSETSYKDYLHEVSEKAKSFIFEKFNISFSIAISSIHKSVLRIPAAYNEALEALEYKIIKGNGSIICIDDIAVQKVNYYYPLDLEQRLINSIKAGEFNDAGSIINEVMEKNCFTGTPSVQMVKCLMFDITGTMLKIIEGIGISGEEKLIEHICPVEKLLNINTVQEMNEQISGIFDAVCLMIEARKKSHNVELKSKILEYINKNYTDFNLNISTIADAFSINPDYMSRFFKEQTGETLLDYIGKVKLEKAKQLLREYDSTINEVAEKVGYSSVSLIRAFKKYEGITPGMFKSGL